MEGELPAEHPLPSLASPFPPCVPGEEVTSAACQLGYHFGILAVSHLPQRLLHEQGEGGGWGVLVFCLVFFFFLEAEFSVGLEVHFPL